jgi:hypothetical protein
MLPAFFRPRNLAGMSRNVLVESVIVTVARHLAPQ